MVSNTGQLGIVMSSARYKRDIRDMDEASNNLMNLRPVTFRYKQDPQAERQYGLIAEEVAKIYPELVSYDADGKVVTVRYHELIPMLLNEAQRQAEHIRQLSAAKADVEKRLSVLEYRMAVRDRNEKLADRPAWEISSYYLRESEASLNRRNRPGLVNPVNERIP